MIVSSCIFLLFLGTNGILFEFPAIFFVFFAAFQGASACVEQLWVVSRVARVPKKEKPSARCEMT